MGGVYQEFAAVFALDHPSNTTAEESAAGIN